MNTPCSFDTIQDRIHQIRREIPDHVTIMAVSKGVSPDAIRAAYAAGIRHFGENRIQEAKAKQPELTDCPEIIWHLIGHLQSNKVKAALSLFDWIDSVDSLSLAKLIDQQAAMANLPPPRVCLQVKLAPDPQKYGWSVSDLLGTLPALSQLHNVRFCGLMTILPLGVIGSEAGHLFSQLPKLAAMIAAQGYPNLDLQVLSMGMSADYVEAVKAGSTQVRLGRILFSAVDRASNLSSH
jgi:pyridoxal phosphate enzyme (YggS family)